MQIYTSEDKRLSDIFTKDWNRNLERHPESATFMGNHKFNDRLGELSEESIQEDYEYEKKILEELNTFNLDNLSEEDKLNWKLFHLKMERSVYSHKFNEHYMPINQMHGIQTYFHRIISMMPFKNEKDYKNYLSRLNQFPRVIDQIIALMEKGIETGLTVSKIAMLDVPNQIERQLSEDITKSSFYDPIRNAKNLNEELKKELEIAIEHNLFGSFKKLKNYLLEKYIPSCRETIGLSDLPNGVEMYDSKLKDFTTTDLTAKEIHEIGIKEVERIFTQIKDVMGNAGFDDYEKFLQYLRTNPDFYFKSPEELLMSYRDFAKRIDKELPRFFKKLPRLPYGVEEIPLYQAPSSPTAYYMSPDITMTRAGIFYANTYQLETRPSYEIECLTLHEAVPGHHLQIALALEMSSLPDFRKVARFISYVEGWALYAEKLGEEMGFFNDPISKFGQLSFEMWRACRLVIDTGIHAFGWDRKKAIDYLQYYTGKSEAATSVEVDRYIVMPGQATSYKIGELKIIELRKKFEEIKNEEFDIREFHDIVLRNGAIPLNILEEYVHTHLS